MKIAILGTGMVGRTIAERMIELGHEVTIGTRSVESTMQRGEKDRFGNPPFEAWLKEHGAIRLATFSEAASWAALVVNATSGMASLKALQAAGAEHLNGKVLIDI